MIIIVGHGPSVSNVPGDFIDQHRVVRLRRAALLVGSRTDVICSRQERYKQPDIEFWHLQGELFRKCVRTLKKFNPRKWKPSTGLSAAIIARDKYPDDDIGVIGFDYTLHPEKVKPSAWRHDAWAERECIESLGVIEL